MCVHVQQAAIDVDIGGAHLPGGHGVHDEVVPDDQ